MKLPIKMAVGVTALAFTFGEGTAVASTTQDAGHAAPSATVNGSTGVELTALSECKGKKVCFWWKKNYKGTFAYAPKEGKKPKCWTFDASNNQAESFVIMSGVKARLYDKKNCERGPMTDKLPPGKRPQMGGWANRVSSVMVY